MRGKNYVKTGSSVFSFNPVGSKILDEEKSKLRMYTELSGTMTGKEAKIEGILVVPR